MARKKRPLQTLPQVTLPPVSEHQALHLLIQVIRGRQLTLTQPAAFPNSRGASLSSQSPLSCCCIMNKSGQDSKKRSASSAWQRSTLKSCSARLIPAFPPQKALHRQCLLRPPKTTQARYGESQVLPTVARNLCALSLVIMTPKLNAKRFFVFKTFLPATKSSLSVL